MRQPSRTSAGATYLDRNVRVSALKEAANRARGKMSSVQRVILFGSLVGGTPTPRSDADLLIIVDRSPHAQMRDRIPAILEALSPLPCPVDVHVITTDEFQVARREMRPLVREARAHGVELL